MMKGLLFLCLVFTGSIVALTGLRQFFIDPFSTTQANIAWFVIQLVPLLMPLPAVLAGSYRGIFVLCLASMLYFIHGVIIAFDAGMQLLAGGEIFCSLALCAVSAIYVRKAREIEGRALP